MEKPNIESYDYGDHKTNIFRDFTLDDAAYFLDQIDDSSAIKLGYAGGEEDLWDAVMREYMITENENALPPFF